MKRIELEIVADNSQYIQSTKEVTQATSTMQKTIHKGEQRTKGLIEDTTEALKDYEAKRRKAFTIEGVEKYNKKIAEAKNTLREYNQAGVEVEKTQQRINTATTSVWKSFVKLLGPILTVTAAFKALKGIINSTQASGDALRNTLGGLKTAADTFFRAIATGNFKDLKDRLKDAGDAGVAYTKALDSIGDRERQLSLIENRRQAEMIELAKIYRNTGLVGAEGYRKRQEAAEAYIKLAEEGEADALEILNMRRDAELILAREQAGFTQEYEKASQGRKDAINEEIIANLELQTTYEQYKGDLDRIKTLYGNIDDLLGPIGRRNENLLPPSTRSLIEENRKALAEYPPAVMAIYEQYKIWGNVTDDTRQRLTDSLNAIQTKQNEVAQGTIRANTMAELSGTMLAKEEGKTLEERQKKLEEFLQATFALQDQYEKDQIDRLEGPERFAAERDYQLKQLAMLRLHLESMGDLTEDHYRWLAGLEESANIEFLKKSADYDQKAFDEVAAHGDKVRELERTLQEEALDLLEDNEEEKLKLRIKFAEEDIKLLQALGDETSQAEIAILKQRIEIWNKEIGQLGTGNNKGFWDAIGLGDNEELQSALKDGVQAAVDALDEIYDARVKDAERTRELLDTQIAETQRSLDAEIKLAEIGYANNVDAKRKEIEDLKAAREKALRDEEKALKAKQAMDTATQISSLLSATANIFKGFSEIPLIGQILAVAAVASMFAAFASAKVRAAQATKLAEGGTGDETGVITGRRHSQGGERFLDHVEVERGERWGVLNRRASTKYGKAFSEIVTSFNKDRVPIEAVTADPNIIVDVNQTNERLDRVHGELVRLNSKFGTKRERTDLGDRIIEKLGPHKTRIIRK